jgi:Domain of unknown function (DUF4382)
MVNTRRWDPGIGCLLAVSAGLIGCAPKTNVSATGNVPAQYSHLFMSVQAIWFNTSATAGPDDTTWTKVPLTTAVTIDLATSVDGTLNSIATGLNVPVGSYAQVRLIPVDSSATLLSSAASLGALYNSEVDYTDSAGTAHRAPLELQNPDKGIGVATSIQVKGGTTNLFSGSGSSSTTSTTNDATSVVPGLSTPNTTDTTSKSPTTTTAPTQTSSTGATSAAPFALAINVDGAKDLVPFSYSTAAGVLLNPHMTAYNEAAAGAIHGTLDITNLTGISSPGTASSVNIQVTAESLSTDGTRHIAVNSAPVSSSGTFTLYPLSTTASSATSYDLVIHGPGIATIIIKGVTVNVGTTTSSTPVNIGTLTPRAATSFKVNLNATTPLQAGALVGFYQTLPGNGEVPYLIEEQPIDPFNRTFQADQSVSAGSIDYGTFASGSTITLRTADPTEGTSTYRVAGTAPPLFADGPLTTTVTAPSGNSSTALVAVPTLAAAAGGAFNTTTVTISQVIPKKYDKGELIVSHDGAIVTTAPLDSILTQGATGTVAVSGLPGGSTSGQFADALYYLSVRTWSSTNPTGTLNREIYPNPLDLRSGLLTSYSLTIN